MNREQFPLLSKVAYLDSAAGTLKPKVVVEAISDFYLNNPINPHSVESALGVKVAKEVKESRELVAELISASSNEVIFTAGTTDGANRLASMLKAVLKPNDEVLLSTYNHSSNVVPWLNAIKGTGAKVVYSEDIYNDINENTKIVAYAQVNNTVSQHIDPERLYKKVKDNNAILVNDAAQAIVHEEVSLHDCDAIIFSGNKLYGPTGIGVLAVRKELLSLLKPSTFGGGATVSINGDSWEIKTGVAGFETGTPNTAGIIGLGAAIKYLNSLGDFEEYEVNLANYAFDELSKIDGIKFYSRKGECNILFNVKEYSSQDVVSHLGHKNIILRSGMHCAKQVNKVINGDSTIRCSISSYNNEEDIDKMVDAIKNGGDFLEFI